MRKSAKLEDQGSAISLPPTDGSQDNNNDQKVFWNDALVALRCSMAPVNESDSLGQPISMTWIVVFLETTTSSVGT